MTRYRAATAILDRAGFAPGVNLTLSRGTPTPLDHLSDEELLAQAQSLAQRIADDVASKRGLPAPGDSIEGEVVPTPQG